MREMKIYYSGLFLIRIIMASGTPITEMPNPLSVDIDVASPENMLRILRQSDSQLFSGFQFFEGIWDECFLRE